jgi:hypothetical protein
MLANRGKLKVLQQVHHKRPPRVHERIVSTLISPKEQKNLPPAREASSDHLNLHTSPPLSTVNKKERK